MDFINHAVGAYSNSPGGSPRKFLAARRTGIIRQTTNGLNDTLTIDPLDLGKLLLCTAQDLDRVIHSPYCSRISHTV